MNYKLLNNNRVELFGEVASDLKFSHELYGEGFYEFVLAVNRRSEKKDYIPITISERLINKDGLKVGDTIGLKGQMRSFNKLVDGKSKLMLTVFVRELAEPNKTIDYSPNIIELCGYLCKKPVYRTTPFNREISDLLIAVNRSYGKSDYIPAIAWGRNARFIKDADIGSKIFISGRIQSRDYQKKKEDGTIEDKTAYEVSINKISLEDTFDSLSSRLISEDDDGIVINNKPTLAIGQNK